MQTIPLGYPLSDIIVFAVLVVVSFSLDLYCHRGDRPVPLKSAVLWSVFWVLISFIYAGFLYYKHGAEIMSLFLTGYALEKVLSVDNLFVFMALFSWFAIPDGLRHRVLYWGIIGAVIFRLVFVAIGTSLLALGPFMELIFALLVGWTGWAMFRNIGREHRVEDYSNHLAYRLVKRFFPLWPRLQGHRFFLKGNQARELLRHKENQCFTTSKVAKLYATPLFLCLAVVELSDVMFAFDSVPAVIAVSREPLIIYSAMIFAVLGLRTLYFVLEGLKRFLVHLEKAVVVLLFYVALKLALGASKHMFGLGYEIPPTTSLVVVLTVLALGVLTSLIFPGGSPKGDDLKNA